MGCTGSERVGPGQLGQPGLVLAQRGEQRGRDILRPARDPEPAVLGQPQPDSGAPGLGQDLGRPHSSTSSGSPGPTSVSPTSAGVSPTSVTNLGVVSPT